MRSRTELMVDRLQDLQAGTPDVEASAVVSVDGLIMASSLPSNVDEDRISAMSAAMLSLGDRIAEELRRGRLQRVYIEGSDGIIVLMAVGERNSESPFAVADFPGEPHHSVVGQICQLSYQFGEELGSLPYHLL